MTPDLSWFGLVWAALLFWVLVGWCPTGPDEADESGAHAGPPGDRLRRTARRGRSGPC
jgi:hypothetical protein